MSQFVAYYAHEKGCAMNQPTWEDFKRLEAGQKRLEEEVRQLREQRTEEIKAVRVDVASEDVTRRLEDLKQELHTVSETWLNTLQEHYNDHKHDIVNVKQAIIGLQTVQSGHAKYFEEHGKRLSKIEASMVTKDDIKNMATKDDIAEMKAMQEQILKLLQQRPPEKE